MKGLAPAGAVPRLVELVGDGAQGSPGGFEQGGQLGGLPVVHVGLRVDLTGYQSLGPRRRRQVGRRPQHRAPRFLGGQRVTGAAGNGRRFLLGDGGQDVQGELVGRGQVHGLEAHPAFHQGGQEGHAAGQAVELGHEQHRAFALGQGDGGRQLGPGTFAPALHLDVVGHPHGLGGKEAVNGGLLGFEAQAGLALAGGAHAKVGDVLGHGEHDYRSIPTLSRLLNVHSYKV